MQVKDHLLDLFIVCRMEESLQSHLINTTISQTKSLCVLSLSFSVPHVLCVLLCCHAILKNVPTKKLKIFSFTDCVSVPAWRNWCKTLHKNLKDWLSLKKVIEIIKWVRPTCALTRSNIMTTSTKCSRWAVSSYYDMQANYLPTNLHSIDFVYKVYIDLLWDSTAKMMLGLVFIIFCKFIIFQLNTRWWK